MEALFVRDHKKNLRVIRKVGKAASRWRWHRFFLTHWGRVTHICVSKLTIIGSENGLSPGRRQAIIWTNAGMLLIWPLGTNFNEILIEIRTFSFKKMHLKRSSAKWQPFCLGLNELKWSLIIEVGVVWHWIWTFSRFTVSCVLWWQSWPGLITQNPCFSWALSSSSAAESIPI